MYVLIAAIMIVSTFAVTASAADKVVLSSVEPVSWVHYHTNYKDGKITHIDGEFSIGINTDADDKTKTTLYLNVDGKKTAFTQFIQLHTCDKQTVNINGKDLPEGNMVWDISKYNYNTFTVIAGLDADQCDKTHHNYTNVYIDDKLVYDGSSNIYTGEKAVKITVKVPEGAKTLKLETVTPKDFRTQRCIWAEPTLYNSTSPATFDGALAVALVAVATAGAVVLAKKKH